MEAITISAIGYYALTIFINVLIFTVSTGLMLLVATCIIATYNCLTERIASRHDGDEYGEWVSKHVVNLYPFMVAAIGAHMALTLALALASYWSSMSLLLCILTSLQCILVVEIAPPIAFFLLGLLLVSMGVIYVPLSDNPPII